ncbi:hypothetical protein [Humisphaera borealis]|uniref:Uncharacterized protein n=1 Tax=Humisphaera borealis TaxID=2807512 RepID=A0A7M2WXH4_9BACT|nr:hypothetical protein [Humisphaera borealis]QOV90103.1 hypothetical protein IPV69_01650 [Humisphaera borealis]
MPDVPQNTGEILPAACEHAARVVAHLAALGDDLKSAAVRRETAEYGQGIERIEAAVDALNELMRSIDGSDAPEPGV